MTAPTRPAADGPGRGLWIGLALGGPLMAWGTRGALDASARVHPGELARWIVGVVVVHDLVVVPATLAVGLVLRRLIPAVAWPPVRWALATSAVAAVVAWPFVRGYGRTTSVPSLLDRSYGSGLLALVAVVWLGAAAWTALRIRRVRPTPRPSR